MAPTAAPRQAADGEDAAGIVLVLYHARQAPIRAAVADHLYSFRRYDGRPCIYLNVAVRRLPAWLDRLPISLVVFHTILLATRWDRRMWDGVLARIQPVKRLRCPRVAIPQDEYVHTERLVALIRDFGVERVLTCSPASELRTIYGDLVDGGVTFERVLPGYLEPATSARIERLEPAASRLTDIGYRTHEPELSLGRHGQLKAEVGRVFERAGRAAGLTTDISVRAEDTILGDDWYRFLLRCRWVVGVEGGASIHDPDGTFLERSRAFRREHPGATFEEAEAATFPGVDGNLAYVAISPRHLEACLTRTGQVLVEGDYNGILEAGVHYLPVRSDFADVEAIVSALSDEGLRTRLTTRAYEDIVASGRFTYATFVRTVAHGLAPRGATRPSGPARALAAWEMALDRPSWLLVRVTFLLRRSARRVLTRIGLLDAVMGRRAGRPGADRAGESPGDPQESR